MSTMKDIRAAIRKQGKEHIESVTAMLIGAECVNVPLMKHTHPDAIAKLIEVGLLRKTRSKKSPYTITEYGRIYLEECDGGRAWLKMGTL